MKLFISLIIFIIICSNWAYTQSWRTNIPAAEVYLDSLSGQISQSRYQEVQAGCKEIIRVYRTHTDAASRLILAQAWSVTGNACLQSGNLENALSSHQEALSLRKAVKGPKTLEVAYSLHNIGNCWLLAQAYPEAEKWLQKSQQIKNRFPEQKDGTTLESLGTIYLKTNRPAQAKAAFMSALRVFQPDNPKSVNTLIALGSYWMDQNTPDSALFYLNLAYSACQKNTAPPLEKMAVIADKRGVSQLQAGRYEAALAECQSALMLFGQLPQVKPAKTGACLKNTGDAYFDIGDLATASHYYQQAAALFQPESFEMAGLLNSMGLLLVEQDEAPEAVNAFRKSITLLWNNTTPAYMRARATAFTNLGNCLMQDQDWEAANYYFKAAAADFSANGDHVREITAQSLAGRCLVQQGRLAEAEKWFYGILRNAPARPSYFPLWYQLGHLHEQCQQYTKAQKSYEMALSCVGVHAMAANTPYRDETIQAYTALARLWLLQENGNGDKALLYADAAIQLAESVKQLARSQSGIVSINSSMSEPYQVAVNICLKKALQDPSYRREAFLRSERHKSHFLRQNALQALLEQAPDLAAEQYAIEEAIEQIRQNEPGQEGQTALDRRLQQLLERQYLLKQQVETRFPEFSRWFQQEHIAGPDEIRQQLAPGQVLLEYQWTEQQLVVFVLKKDTFEVNTLQHTDSLAAAIRRLWSYYTHPPSVIASTNADSIHQSATATAHGLFKALLGSVERDSGSTLLIVPDHLLCYLPFDALIINPSQHPSRYWTHRYVTDAYQVQYAPSAGAFWPVFATQPSTGALVTAPVFSAQCGLDSLENSRQEAQLIQQITHAQTLSGTQATRQRFLEEAGHVGVLHLATHGVINHRNPERSYLAFSHPEEPDNYSRLFLSEIYRTRIPAELVVMTACHSGGGKLYEGEGLISLAHAFQYAGARRVMASLWAVDDAASPLLMEDFYTFMAVEKNSMAQAMARAKSVFIRRHRNKSHPYYWAGFVGWGSAEAIPSTVFPASVFTWKQIFIGGAMLLVLLLIASTAYKIRTKKFNTGT